MIQEYIDNQQYQEALKLLGNLEDEQTRYLRLVCLFGLQEYNQAYQEIKFAKNNAKETYYDIVAMEVGILKELQQFEEAINILIEELSMPYIPYQYESTFNAAYDDILLAKQEATSDVEYKNSGFNIDEIANILSKEVVNEDILYMCIENMQNINIRKVLPEIRMFLKSSNKPDFAKSLIIELLIDQAIDEEMIVHKFNHDFEINPSYAQMVLQQEIANDILMALSRNIEDDNPSLFIMAEQYANYYLYCIYPKYVDETDANIIAGAIHYHLATLQFIEVELEDIEILYQVDANEVLEMIEKFKNIQL